VACDCMVADVCCMSFCKKSPATAVHMAPFSDSASAVHDTESRVVRHTLIVLADKQSRVIFVSKQSQLNAL